MSDELWMEVHDTGQEAVIKTIPMEKEMQKGKMAVLGVLTNSSGKKKKKEAKAKEKRKDISI